MVNKNLITNKLFRLEIKSSLHQSSSLEIAYLGNQVPTAKSIQITSKQLFQFNSIQFNSIQFNSMQLKSIWFITSLGLIY